MGGVNSDPVLNNWPLPELLCGTLTAFIMYVTSGWFQVGTLVLSIWVVSTATLSWPLPELLCGSLTAFITCVSVGDLDVTHVGRLNSDPVSNNWPLLLCGLTAFITCISVGDLGVTHVGRLHGNAVLASA